MFLGPRAGGWCSWACQWCPSALVCLVLLGGQRQRLCPEEGAGAWERGWEGVGWGGAARGSRGWVWAGWGEAGVRVALAGGNNDVGAK